MICISLGNKGVDAIKSALVRCEEFVDEARSRYGVGLAVEIRIDLSELEEEDVTVTDVSLEDNGTSARLTVSLIWQGEQLSVTTTL